MCTSVDGNSFSAVVFQVFDAYGNFIENIDSISESGKVSGYYINDLDNGNYTFMVRGNTNKADETIASAVELARGDAVKYEFSVESLDPKELVVSGINVVKLVRAE